MIERLLQNWPYKLVALITAVSLWAFVNSERNPIVTVSRSVHLEFRNLDTKNYVITGSTNDIDVSLQGPKSYVDDYLRTADVKAWADLEGRGAGTYAVPVSVSPHEADQVSVRPVQPTVTLTVESVSSRILPVEVNLVSSPPVGYSYGDPKVTPSSVTISGRSSVVDSVRRLAVMVDPGTAAGLDIDRYYSITALDAGGNEMKGIEIDPAKVRVTLNLVAVPARKSVFVSPSIVGQPEFPYKVTKVSVNPEAVIIKGKPASIFDISTLSTEDVNIDGATGNVVKEVKLRVLPGLELEGANSVRVSIRIEMKQE